MKNSLVSLFGAFACALLAVHPGGAVAQEFPRTTVRIIVSVCNAPNGGEGLNAAWELNATGNDHIRRDVRVPEPVLNWCIGRCALA